MNHRKCQIDACLWVTIGLSLCASVLVPTARGSGRTDDEYFEKQIRPILVEHCQSCHGDQKSKGGLRLTSPELMIRGGDTGPAIVPGKPDRSLLISAISYLDEPKMPPKQKLPDADIARLTRWVAAGALWPAAAKTTPSAPSVGDFQATDAQKRWWAFQPVRDRIPPGVKNVSWARNEIDRFILAELAAHGMQPASPAERRAWIRRATFDLTGLPPDPSDVAAFLIDRSADAYEKVVDRLLASSAYGERWARHWLDVARYADYYDANPATRTASCELTEAWRYRDWVVDSLNADLPFDLFVVRQIAGDLLPPPAGKEIDPGGLIATTFLANGAWDRGDADKEKMVSDMVDDNIDTVGKAFLGLSLGCARCHDHKFDPISQEDYYGLAGIFYSSHFLKDLGAKGAEYVMNRVPLVPRSVVARRDEHVKQLNETMTKLAELDKKKPKPAGNDPEWLKLIARREALQRELPPEPPLAMAIQDGGTPGGLFPGIQDVPIHVRGSYTRLGMVVPRRLPRFLAGETQQRISKGSGRRELADWVASASNPLTARVIVNRVWQWHFGEGLVRTPSNFGLRSEPPTHPALLDWVAARFVEDGWSLKKLHRRIMLSATYQQTSVVSRDEIERDPENRWMGRFSARRLEAEAVRDAMLSVAGRLDRARRGPAGDDLTIGRRSLFVQTARWDRSNYATLFDAANPDASVEKRDVSTIAPQSLFLLNHGFVTDQARHLAQRLIREVPASETDRIDRVFQLLFSRPARAEEVEIGLEVVHGAKPPKTDAGWVDLAHVLLCANEFVYLD